MGRPLAPAERLRDALDAVALHHGVRLHELVLVRAGSLPKTSSWKIRRASCRALSARGALRGVLVLGDADARAAAPVDL